MPFAAAAVLRPVLTAPLCCAPQAAAAGTPDVWRQLQQCCDKNRRARKRAEQSGGRSRAGGSSRKGCLPRVLIAFGGDLPRQHDGVCCAVRMRNAIKQHMRDIGMRQRQQQLRCLQQQTRDDAGLFLV